MASKEVVLHLIKSKCVPVLLYAVEVCPVNLSLQGSFEFPFTELIKRHKLQFLQKIVSSSNTVCTLFTSVAVRKSELLAANT